MATAAPVATWKQDTIEGLVRGSRVWYKASSTDWIGATLLVVSPSECTFITDSPAGPNTGETRTSKPEALVPANPPVLDGVNDLTGLSYLNEPSILFNLQERYQHDLIYSHAGPVLIAVNPFKGVQKLYTKEVLQHYTARSTNAQSDAYEPHIFLTADKAYKEMCRTGASQSIVINGESGAGKTETTKIAMRYLAGLAGGTGVEDRVLETNPLLEAFGNAKTLRNNNSSRFGKLIQIYFNNSRHICGALIQTYLLEKSRVTQQLPAERNYHIFYQLCKGATYEERKQFHLPEDLNDFSYLAASGCSEIEGVDDAHDFVVVKHSMGVVGIDPDSQALMFGLLAAILWLGNVEYRVKTADSVEVVEGPAVSHAAQLLGVPEPQLMLALSKRKITAGGEIIDMDLKMEAALDTRDALAKSIYAALFRWLVEKVNAALSVGNKRTSGTSLSILDIYGFECFKQNSFEQLCINYANERLQQQFNRHLFKLEQEVYGSEDIDWRHVDFEDNQLCVDLIESRPPKGVGILSLLDEECIYPKATDSTFAAKMRQNLTQNPHFGYDKRSMSTDFTVDHFAGDVVYSCNNFLDKNRDTLSTDLTKVMSASSHPLLATLAVGIAAGQDKRGSQTVGFRFREQLQNLISLLDKTELHFVRCIKPNGLQVASTFDAQLALHQLRCCGVLEVTRIARAGYPTRYLHAQFAERYHVLLHGAGAGWEGRTTLDVCMELLSEFRIPQDMFQVGRTKLFFRAGVLGHLEDTSARINRSVLLCQSHYRMVVCRRAFLHKKAAATRIQSHARGQKARADFKVLLQRHQAAKVIQAGARGAAARRKYRRTCEAIVSLQVGLRRWQLSKRLAARQAIRRQQEAEEAAAAALRQKAAQEWEKVQKRFGMDAEAIVDIVELWVQHGKAFMEWKDAPPPPPPQPLPLSPSPREVPSSSTPLQSPLQQQEQQPREVQSSPLPDHDEPRRSASPTAKVTAAAAAIVASSATVGAVANQAVSHGDQGPHTPRSQVSLAEGSLTEASSAPGHDSESDGDGGIVVPESALEQIALWEEYSCKLEQRVHALTHENDTLQRQIAGVQDTLAAAGMEGMSEAGTPQSVGSRAREHHSLTPLPLQGTPETNGVVQWGDAKAIIGNGNLAANGEQHVVKLHDELGKRAPMFVDDANFIREVKEGISQTVFPMDPDAELTNLVRTWADFKRDFESRLDDTATVLKKVEQSRSPLAANNTDSIDAVRLPLVAATTSAPPSPGEEMSDGSRKHKHKSLMSKFSRRNKSSVQEAR